MGEVVVGNAAAADIERRRCRVRCHDDARATSNCLLCSFSLALTLTNFSFDCSGRPERNRNRRRGLNPAHPPKFTTPTVVDANNIEAISIRIFGFCGLHWFAVLKFLRIASDALNRISIENAVESMKM